MDQAITIGMLVWWVVIAGGAILVIGGLLWLLSVLASGFNH
jgi:hypothetical protein